MDQLVNIENKELTMSSREIADLCEKEHKTVIRDIRSMLISLYGEEYLQKIIPEKYRNRHSEYIRENADSILNALFGDGTNWNHENKQGFSWSRDSRGYVEIFNLNKEHSFTLVAGYNVKLRKAIIDRWQKLEEQNKFPIPQTLPEALRLAANLADQNMALQQEVEEIKPQALALKRLSHADGLACITDAAKTLQVRPKELFDFLSFNRWIYRRAGGKNWVAYEDKRQMGLLTHKTTIITTSDGIEHARDQVLVTTKGLTKLAAMLNKEKEVA